MILSDKTIRKMLEDGILGITPLEAEQIQPASVDIRLGRTFSVVEDTASGIISMDQQIGYKAIESDTYCCFRGNLFWPQQWNMFLCRIILLLLWKDAVLLAAWVCSFKMQAGWTRDFRERLRWNYSMPTAAPLSFGQAAAWASLCLRRWTDRQIIPITGSTKARPALRDPKHIWMKKHTERRKRTGPHLRSRLLCISC